MIQKEFVLREVIEVMKQVFVKKGQVIIEEVPAPVVHPGTVLVRNEFSCISTGTELSGLKSSSMPLWQRAFKGATQS